jgi:hypothetical protein
MGFAAILLIFWPLLYLGYRWNHFTLGESLALACIWLLLLGAVVWSGQSIWWFAIPGAALTIFVIVKVLGWNTESGHYTDV